MAASSITGRETSPATLWVSLAIILQPVYADCYVAAGKMDSCQPADYALCKLGAAGVTFSYYLQKRREVSAPHALLFSSMYAMMAYAVIQLIDPMWLDGLVFLPLIIAGLECLVDDGRKINYSLRWHSCLWLISILAS